MHTTIDQSMVETKLDTRLISVVFLHVMEGRRAKRDFGAVVRVSVRSGARGGAVKRKRFVYNSNVKAKKKRSGKRDSCVED